MLIMFDDKNTIRYDAVSRTVYENSDTVKKDVCPFCGDKLKSEELYRDYGDGIVFVKNKFNLYRDLENYLLIESDKCINIHNLSDELVLKNLQVTSEIKDDLLKKYVEVVVLKQFGPFGGGSVRHGHIQIIGLEKSKINFGVLNPTLLAGIELFNNENVKVSLCENTLNEFIEFNIEYDNLNIDVAKKLKILLNFILDNSSGIYKDNGSYSFSFHDYNGKKYIKVLERKKMSSFKSNFGINLVNIFDAEFISYLKLLLK